MITLVLAIQYLKLFFLNLFNDWFEQPALLCQLTRWRFDFFFFLNTGSQRKKRLSWPNMQYLNCVAKLPYTSVPSSVLSSVPSCCLLHFVDVYKYGRMTSFLFIKKQEPFLILPLLLLFSCCLEENLQVFVFKSTCLMQKWICLFLPDNSRLSFQIAVRE